MQQETGWPGVLRSLDTGKLAILMIFGAGIIYALGYAVSSAIRAYHAAPDESEEITERLDELEKRIAALEKREA
jgi:hypothetical protein